MELDSRLNELFRPGDSQLSISRIRSDGSGLILYSIASAFVVFFTEILGVSIAVAILIIVGLLIWQVLQKAVNSSIALHPKSEWGATIPRVFDIGYTVLVIGTFYALMQLYFTMLNSKVATTEEGVGMSIILIFLIAIVLKLPQPIEAAAQSDEEYHAALCLKMVYNDVQTNSAKTRNSRERRPIDLEAVELRALGESPSLSDTEDWSDAELIAMQSLSSSSNDE
jgi:hypothetical protein